MIFSKDLLFLHVPKTGGMSITELLLETLRGPVYYSHPNEAATGDHKVVHIDGIRHETLEQARDIVASYGFALESFPAILMVVRNPYALEVSRYSYLRGGHPWDFGFDQTLALTRDFTTFARNSHESPDLSRYFFLGREVLQNLRVIRFERMGEDLPAALSDIGVPCDRALPHENRSRHGDYRTYYDRLAEEAVYRRHRWFFDLSLYERMDLDVLKDRKEDEPDLMLPIVGPVRQLGVVTGFWPDLWAGPTVRTTLEALNDVGFLEVHGYLPVEARKPVEYTAVADGKTIGTIQAQPGSEMRWTLPLAPRGGASFEFEMRASRSWRPRENGVDDKRELALQVIRMFFRRAK